MIESHEIAIDRMLSFEAAMKDAAERFVLVSGWSRETGPIAGKVMSKGEMDMINTYDYGKSDWRLHASPLVGDALRRKATELMRGRAEAEGDAGLDRAAVSAAVVALGEVGKTPAPSSAAMDWLSDGHGVAIRRVTFASGEVVEVARDGTVEVRKS